MLVLLFVSVLHFHLKFSRTLLSLRMSFERKRLILSLVLSSFGQVAETSKYGTTTETLYKAMFNVYLAFAF